MKTTILTTALAGFGLTLLPLHAEVKGADSPTPPAKVATENTSAKTISTYIVHVSGGG